MPRKHAKRPVVYCFPILSLSKKTKHALTEIPGTIRRNRKSKTRVIDVVVEEWLEIS